MAVSLNQLACFGFKGAFCKMATNMDIFMKQPFSNDYRPICTYLAGCFVKCPSKIVHIDLWSFEAIHQMSGVVLGHFEGRFGHSFAIVVSILKGNIDKLLAVR